MHFEFWTQTDGRHPRPRKTSIDQVWWRTQKAAFPKPRYVIVYVDLPTPQSNFDLYRSGSGSALAVNDATNPMQRNKANTRNYYSIYNMLE